MRDGDFTRGHHPCGRVYWDRYLHRGALGTYISSSALLGGWHRVDSDNKDMIIYGASEKRKKEKLHYFFSADGPYALATRLTLSHSKVGVTCRLQRAKKTTSADFFFCGNEIKKMHTISLPSLFRLFIYTACPPCNCSNLTITIPCTHAAMLILHEIDRALWTVGLVGKISCFLFLFFFLSLCTS